MKSRGFYLGCRPCAVEADYLPARPIAVLEDEAVDVAVDDELLKALAQLGEPRALRPHGPTHIRSEDGAMA